MGGTVLVVDDQPEVADLHARQLEDEHAVRVAYDGEEALEKADEDVDVVLLDRRMPTLSGDEVLERLRQQGLDCRVVMVTAVTPDFDIVDMPFDDYLVKPSRQDELLDVVDRMLSRESYHDLAREFFRLSSKRAALEAHKPPAELEDNEEFQRLEDRIQDIRSQLDTTMDEFEEQDYHDLFQSFGDGETNVDVEF